MAFVLAIVAGSCSDNETAKPSGDAPIGLADGQYVENAAVFVDAADWDSAKTVQVELGEMFFKPKTLSFEAGQPYKLELSNAGEVKHEFVARDFFRSGAFRKAEDDSAEVKVPFFTEIEVFAGESLELFFVPLVPGTYELICEIEGHREAGMEGTITVTGSAPTTPTPLFADIAAGPWVQDGQALVDAADWDARQVVRVELGDMFFSPKEILLKVGTPYVLEFVNVGKIKHEFVADDFLTTVAFRKAEDASGEYKGPTLREAEVFADRQLDLYLIPTQPGTFLLVCEIEGHREAGMEGTITVTE